ncbi:energy-coupling factor transport system ATP-binding protein [Sporomusaceae bacterium BoRhaA]|uniref:energy-coupling factor transporter ATPase n=1 Tax=Pelorhabdus rhamnosifermentans TaxID=2772457 RepID=UPI001C064890|nr:energy-coupling factor transporter ATPase [Pelorhabdus rhamnosifermentans]MBU2701647.1 energy-coupling factor transport system ATP-binding protein [Pelorhabdus rhamnosifermentans]
MSIQLTNVTYTYMPGTPYEQSALKTVNLTIEKGEFVGVIGHTGSGKSTLIQHMNGLLQPTIGTVTLDGIDLKTKTKAAREARHHVGMVFQYPEHQLFEETVAADIAFGPRNLGLSASEVEERVHYAMDFVNLDYDTFALRSPFALSGGQMRRVSIAGVMALKPDYLILDEPSAGLDPGGRKEIFEEIVKYYESAKITIILVSHNMDEIAQVANRLIVMDQGNILIDGSPAHVFGKERHKLHQAGVDVPPITALMTQLAAKGLAVDSSLIRIDDAVQNICQALAVKEGHHAQ